MKYILDFDEVLFNTTALKEKMALLDIPESARGTDVFTLIQEHDPSFSFASLVFPGALKFLQEHGADCIIVSSASSVVDAHNTDQGKQFAFQSEKIRLSGVEALVNSVHVVCDSKATTLQKIKDALDAQGEDMVFLDDREKYVRDAQELGIKSIWMDREGKGHLVSEGGVLTMLEFPRVGSFAEFVALVESWKHT